MPFQSYMNQVCPAKVNLILRVGAKRRDGYHEIESLMVRTTWGDRLSLRVRAADITKITLKTPGLKLKAEKNLVYRAAAAFSKTFKVAFEAEILLKKIVPTGAGLGGGSSDAAKTLELLFKWKFKSRSQKAAEYKKLLKVAAGLGADIPFFLGTEASWCTGFGEKLAPVSVPKLWMAILLPTTKVPTGWAYGELDRSRKSGGRYLFGKPSWLSEAYQIPALENDFEGPVVAAKPRLAKMRGFFAASGALASIMSGSGSAFFGVYASKKDSIRAVRWLNSRGLKAIATASA